MPREERTRDSGRDRDRDRDRGRDRPRDSGRDGAPTPNDRDRGGRGNRSRSPRRERGGRRSDNRYRSRSPLRGSDKERDSGRGDRGRDDRGRDDRYGRDDRGRDDRGREPPKGPRGIGGRNGDFKSTGGLVKAPTLVKEDIKSEPDDAKDVKMEDQPGRPEGMDDESWEMYKSMGFAGFKSTKETKVPGNDRNYGVRKEKELKARQYMNRQGGFNRPLSPSRDG